MTKQPKITVVSSIMGTVKTSWACQKMNAEKNTPFIYVTPFDDETKEIVKRCEGRDFVRPMDKSTKRVRHNKSDDLQALTFEGRNVATTHNSRLGFVSRKWPQDLPFHRVSPSKNDRLDKITLLAKPKSCRHTN